MHATTESIQRGALRLAISATRAEQFSIWAMRLWWRSFPQLDSGWSDFLHGFRVCGVAPAVESCHRFCSIALAASACGSGIACVHYPRIVPMEEQLLSVFSVANLGESDRVESLLRGLLPETSVRTAAPLVIHYAQILEHAGMQWPHRPIAPYAGRARRVSVMAGSERLH